MSDSEIEDTIEAAEAVLLVYRSYLLSTSLNNYRRFWTRDYFKDRNSAGFFATSFNKLENDPEQFFIATRMTLPVFNALYNLLSECLEKNSNRPAIPSKCRLLLTLMYLAHGGSRQHLSLSFKISVSAVRNIVLETCEAIWRNLSQIYIAKPNCSEWERIAEDFHSMWDLPNCVGAIDGKHIAITCPANSGSNFYNYKGHYSIVLMAICDANYTFVAVDVGAYGSQRDGGILSNSEIGKRLLRDNLGFPDDRAIPGSDTKLSFYIVGDAAFPLKKNLMRPYPGFILDEQKDNFNKRLSRARRVVENAFGILVARWRIFHGTLNMSPESAEKIVNATVVLHNFVKMSDGKYCPPAFTDDIDENGEIKKKGLWREEVKTLSNFRPSCSNNSPKSAFKMRDLLKEYLFENKLRQNNSY